MKLEVMTTAALTTCVGVRGQSKLATVRPACPVKATAAFIGASSDLKIARIKTLAALRTWLASGEDMVKL